MMVGTDFNSIGEFNLSASCASAQANGRVNRIKNFVTMNYFSYFKKKVISILCGLFFLVTVCSTSACNNKKQLMLSACLSAKEKADLEYFFRSLIFENYGAFVLFGSKPLCEMHLSDLESREENGTALQKWLESLPEDERAALEAKLEKKTKERIELERNLYSGWLVWEKVRKTFDMKHYILRITPVPVPGRSHETIPGSYRVMLVDIQKTALVLAENYNVFKDATGMDFHPLQAVFELQNPESVFWKNVFSIQNHLAKGLLFGFGLRNSIFGNWHFTYLNKQSFSELEYQPSDSIIEYLESAPCDASTTPSKYTKGSPSNFTIPLFGSIAGDDTAEKYTKEKNEIEKIYRGQDLVEVTLQRLAS
jgi:hypothetical protein